MSCRKSFFLHSVSGARSCVQTVPAFPPQHWGNVKPYQDLFNKSVLINSLSALSFIIFKRKTENKTREKEDGGENTRESAYLRDFKSSFFPPPSPVPSRYLSVPFPLLRSLHITLLQARCNHCRCECGGRCIVGPQVSWQRWRSHMSCARSRRGKVNRVKVSSQARVYSRASVITVDSHLQKNRTCTLIRKLRGSWSDITLCSAKPFFTLIAHFHSRYMLASRHQRWVTTAIMAPTSF